MHHTKIGGLELASIHYAPGPEYTLLQIYTLFGVFLAAVRLTGTSLRADMAAKPSCKAELEGSLKK